MMPGILGLPTTAGNEAEGASSPATPALHIPEPLSITIAAYSLSAISIKVLEDIKKYFTVSASN